MPLQPYFQRSVAMHRHGYTIRASSLGIDVVTSVDADPFPSLGFQETTESLTTDGLQTAISMILSFSEIVIS